MRSKSAEQQEASIGGKARHENAERILHDSASRAYEGLREGDYPFHDRDILVIACAPLFERLNHGLWVLTVEEVRGFVGVFDSPSILHLSRQLTCRSPHFHT
jgi:hypothetical protein